MNVLVPGATGFLGRAVCLRLIEQGFDVTGTGRDLAAGRSLPAIGARFILADLRQSSAVGYLCHNIDYVINCSGLVALWGQYSQFYANNVLTTRNLLESAVAHGVKGFVQTSTAGVYFDFSDRFMVNEHDALGKNREPYL